MTGLIFLRLHKNEIFKVYINLFLISQVDIEGSEFSVLTELKQDFKNRLPFGHLNVEIHLNSQATLKNLPGQRKEYQKMYKLFESLEEAGLRAWFSEGNHFFGAVRGGPPTLMEYAFINILNTERNRLIQF
jgi:hypothetical protein